MNRIARAALTVLVLAVTFAAVACGSDPPAAIVITDATIPDDAGRTTQPDGAIATARDAASDPPMDAAKESASGDAGECHALAQTAPLPNCMASTTISPQQGGTITPGVYHLTRQLSTTPTCDGNSNFRLTLRFTGGVLEITQSDASGATHERSTWNVTTAGSTLTMSRTCRPGGKPPAKVEQIMYTATASRLTLHVSATEAEELELE